MATTSKKIVDNVVNSLDKLPSPGKKTISFWSYLKDQLYSEATWDQNDLAVIEKEIKKELDKLNKKDLVKLWEDCDAAQIKLDEGTEASENEMKSDLINDLLGKVMDRMDDNYTSGFTSSYVAPSSSKKSSEEKDEDVADEEELEPTDLDEKIVEDEFFDDETFDEDEEDNF